MLCVTGIIDAWNGNKSHVLLAKVGPYKVFYQDIFQLGPGQELESEVHIPEFQRHYGFTCKVLIIFNVDVGNQFVSENNGEAACRKKSLPPGHFCHDIHVAEKKSKTEGVLKHDNGVGGGGGGGVLGSEIERRGFICSVLQVQATSYHIVDVEGCLGEKVGLMMGLKAIINLQNSLFVMLFSAGCLCL